MGPCQSEIRDARLEDIPEILEMAKMFYAYSGLKDFGLTFDIEGCKLFVENMIANGTFLISDGGMIAATVGPWMCNPSQRILAEAFWWVDPNKRNTGLGRKLLVALEDKAKELGISHVAVGTIPKKEKVVQRLFRRYGYTPEETLMMKEVH